MLADYSLKMPQTIVAGAHALEQFPSLVPRNTKKIAVFTDKGVFSAGLVGPILSDIKKMGLDYTVIKEIPSEPTVQKVQEIIDQFNEEQADLILGVGGGSVMDVAKLASILAADMYTVKDLLAQPLAAKKQCTCLLIPTTAGTGSEATPNSIVGVPEKELKIGIVNPEMIADSVILDPRMIKNLPKSVAAATGVDALCHAIECFTSAKANPISQTFALEALDLIMNNLVESCLNPEDSESKSNMLLGSFYAGVAITSSGTTAVHALSYPLGGKYHIPHGVSNAMLLTPVMKFNEPAINESLALAYDRVVKSGNLALSMDEKSKWMIDKMANMVKILEIPTSLKVFNVTEEDLDVLVAAAMEVTRLLANNKREVTPADARNIYQAIL